MVIVHVIEPFASGVTTAIISISRQLREVNHIVVHGSRTWVDNEENVKRKFPPGVTFIPWKHAGREISPVKDLLALGSLLGILKKLKGPDMVVHLHSSKAGFLGRLACLLLGIRRVIYTPHGASFIRGDVSPVKRKIFWLFEKLGGSFGGLVVGCGKGEAELYRGLGKRVLWVANGAAPGEDERPDKPEKALICFVGIANRQKNPVLFNAIAQAFREEENAQGKKGKERAEFLWVGEGILKDRLTAPNIRLTGWVNSEQVNAWLKQSLIYLSASGWEGLPYGVLEAMKASCALLLTDVPGNRDLVQPGINGFLFTGPGRAVELLKGMLADRKKTLAMGRESRKMMERYFSLKPMGEGYLNIYKALAGGQPVPPQGG